MHLFHRWQLVKVIGGGFTQTSIFSSIERDITSEVARLFQCQKCGARKVELTFLAKYASHLVNQALEWRDKPPANKEGDNGNNQ